MSYIGDVVVHNNVGDVNFPSRARETASKGEMTFGTMLKDVIQEVDQLQKEADESVKKLAMGEGKTIHETMIALEKAGISFQLMIEVRNKIIAAYEEVMRMQI